MTGHGELRRSTIVNWLVAVLLSVFASLVPALDEPPVAAVLAHVPPAVLAVVVAVPLLEFVWRDGLRPRLMWNDYGVTVVRAYRAETVRWSEIKRVREDGNTFRQLTITTVEATLAWEFDHFLLASLMSKRYAARAGRNEKILTEALDRWRGADPDPRAAPPAMPRRPVGLYLLLIPPPVIATVLFQW